VRLWSFFMSPDSAYKSAMPIMPPILPPPIF
jgi:hypothetical protein